jgi:heptose I phosphotransferase
MSTGSFLNRWRRGTRWSWVNPRHVGHLPQDLDAKVMDLNSGDRFHAKQGRATFRIRLDGPEGGVSVYLKRHERLPRWQGLLALWNPRGLYSPGGTEWRHLESARGLGLNVPEPVAAGEQIGPRGSLRSYLLVAELVDHKELNIALPELSAQLPPAEFARLKQSIVHEAARMTAVLHNAKAFHKDLYLCHFFLDMKLAREGQVRLALIDLHRLGWHGCTAPRWRWKDLAQLLFSTFGVEGIRAVDVAHFWREYCRLTGLWLPRLQAWVIRAKAMRYLRHERRRHA